MSFIDRIREANTHDLRQFRPFTVAGQRIGFIHHDLVAELRRWPDVFEVQEAAVALTDALTKDSLEQRNAAFAEVILQLRTDNWFGQGWWDEAYAANRYFGEPPSLLIERAAIQTFGVCGYGVHINGYVRSPDGIKMWIGRRALDKPSAPGKLDQIVAGGQPANLGLLENVIKECAEEADIPAEIAQQAVPVGAITYCLQTQYGLRPDVLYNYDLELPADFTPVNTDGEVEEFYCWSLEEVSERVRETTDFKFNCSLVVIDFLIRHGFISPEHPDYIALISGLRQRELALSRFNL